MGISERQKFSNGPGITGVIALDQQSEFNGDNFESILAVTELGGTPFLGEQTEDVMTLTYNGTYSDSIQNNEE